MQLEENYYIIIITMMNWIVSFQNLYVETFIPNLTVFGERDLKEATKVKWSHKHEALLW